MGELKDGKENVAFDINGYHGQINFGPAQFYIDPKVMRLSQAGTLPLDIMFWANSFYGTKLVARKTEAARICLAGCVGVAGGSLKDVQVEENVSPEALGKLTLALDDLRILGELDIRLNHADRR